MARPTSADADSAQTQNSEAAKYYEDFLGPETGEDAIQSLDDPKVLAESMQSIASSSSRNFLVDFSDSDAWVGFDLSAQAILDLLGSEPRPDELNTRWINIWFPFQHKPLLELLAKHYDFSPRLLAMMCSDPRRARAHGHPPSSRASGDHLSTSALDHQSMVDIEKGEELPEVASISSNNPARSGNIYDMADEIWHYTSVDQGRNYLCLGYNSIYNTGTVELSPHNRSCRIKPPLPHCKRVWTWLLLCRDRTVITINEDPFPYSQGSLDHLERDVLLDTRRNLINVFRSLSFVEEPISANPLTLLPIRKRLGNTAEENAHRMSDAPGVLFYYLFENWFNSYSIVTRRDSRYGIALEDTRANMFRNPGLEHIDRLDQIGNQLGVLKRHYESYIRVIDRVIEPPSATPASLNSSQILRTTSDESFGKDQMAMVANPITEANSLLGTSLSSASRVRFERLKDLIYLYALSEVKDYLVQKDGLVQMNFQLIAIKESRDVERLTRVSLLITKATILFLPVSFMSAYFSTDLSNQQYTVQQYWIAFAGVFTLSWVALLGFGVMSGTMETWVFFPPLKAFVQRHMGKYGRKTRSLH